MPQLRNKRGNWEIPCFKEYDPLTYSTKLLNRSQGEQLLPSNAQDRKLEYPSLQPANAAFPKKKMVTQVA